MTEEWVEFDDGWHVSNLGRVRSAKGKYIKPRDRKGAIYIQYRVQGAQQHRGLATLVAECFVKMPCAGCRSVIHKDGDRANNRADNLEWRRPKGGTE